MPEYIAQQEGGILVRRIPVFGFSHQGTIHVICDDGSMWFLIEVQEPQQWRRVPDIPPEHIHPCS